MRLWPLDQLAADGEVEDEAAEAGDGAGGFAEAVEVFEEQVRIHRRPLTVSALELNVLGLDDRDLRESSEVRGVRGQDVGAPGRL